MNKSDIRDVTLEGIFPWIIFLDVLMLLGFVFNVVYKNKNKIFGNKKTTKILDFMFIFLLLFLIVQSFVCLSVFQSFDNVLTGTKCSVLNFVFHFLHFTLKALSFGIVFQTQYIWFKQNELTFLNSGWFNENFLKLVPCFFIAFSICLHFKINLDVVFIARHGICLGKEVGVYKTLKIISQLSGILVFIFMVFVQFYFLYLTNKYKPEYLYRLKYKLRTSNTQRSIKGLKNKVDFIFRNIRKQINTFTALLFSFLSIFFGHYYVMKTVEFDAFKNVSVFSFPPFFFQHVYQVVICILLVVFRIKVF